MRTLSALLALVFSNIAFASEVLPVQGVLYDDFGDTVDAVLPVQFTIYGNAAGSDVLWTVNRPVSFEDGTYTLNLGELTALPAELFADDPTTWLGIAVDGDTEMDLIKIGQVPYAAAATYAEYSLESNNAQTLGGASLAELTYTAGEGLGLSAGEFSVDPMFVEDLARGVCFDDESELLALLADDFEPLGSSPDWATLADKPAGFADDIDNDALGMLGMSCMQGGQPLWDAALMMWSCVDAYTDADAIDAVIGAGLAEGTLPINGLNEISNQLLTNQFVDTFAQAGIGIPDNSPPGVESTITVPSIGLAETLTVSLELNSSDTSGLLVELSDPAGNDYVLFDGAGTVPDVLISTSWPDASATVTGDLEIWTGVDPTGDWTLKVTDSAFLNNAIDGEIVEWSIAMQTISSGRIAATADVEVAGDLDVDGVINTGAITATGGLDVTGDVAFDGLTTGLRLGEDDTACTVEKEGTLRWKSPIGLEACDGTRWVAAKSRPVIWHGGCSVDTSTSWRFFCTDTTTYDTATETGYLTVDDTTSGSSTADTTGRITANIGGYYRVSWSNNGDNHLNKYVQLYKNGTPIHYILSEHDNSRWRHVSATTVVKLEDGDYLNLRTYSDRGTNTDDDGGYVVDGVTHMSRSWITVEYMGADW